MAKTKPRLYIRKFLNRPGHHTVASVLATVGRGGVTFVLSDCDRSVKLDFSAYRVPDRKNAIYKANQLIDVFTQLRDAMEAEFKSSKDDMDD